MHKVIVALSLIVAALLAVIAPAQGALSLRGSAFVPVAAPSCPGIALNMGSLVNKPGANGNPGGPLVGTGKQKKRQMEQMEIERVKAKEAKKIADAAKQAARDE